MKLNEVCRHADRAVRLGAYPYAILLCEHVLRFFPGDARTRSRLGQACLGSGDHERARQQFDLALEYDPEDETALAALGVVHSAQGRLGAAVKAFERAYDLNPANDEVRDSLARLYAERGGAPTSVPQAPAVAIARWRLRHEPIETALEAANALLVSQPGNVAVAMARAEALWRSGRLDDAERACRQILTRHPHFLKPRFILGLILVADARRQTEGVEMLHLILADDPTGAVVGELRAASPVALPILGDEVELPIRDAELEPPAEIGTALDVPTASVSDRSEEWRPPASALTPPAPSERPRPAERTSPGGETERPRESLVVISSRNGLVARYGSEGFERVERRLQATRRELGEFGVKVDVAFVDDRGSLAELGVEPVSDLTPESTQRVIGELIERVGAAQSSATTGILIVGGDDIVPFYRLPNPALDGDPVVLSDALYGCAEDDSIYAPSRAVGRLPDGGNGSLSLLLRLLDNLTEARRRPKVTVNGTGLLRGGLSALGALGRGFVNTPAFATGLAEWHAVVAEVVGGLPGSPAIRLSPPITADEFNVHWLNDRRFLHFALHGDSAGAAWYGHVVFDADTNDPFLPVTVEIEQLAGADLSGPIVFADASYAGNIVAKTTAQSLAMRFLSEGATAVVGPTGLAYGSPQLPLASGDLFGYLFWNEVGRGIPTGEALRRARQHYHAHACERQGFLDGEDQKLLLQYVLYGDPLLAVCASTAEGADELAMKLTAPVLCGESGVGGGAVPPRQLRQAMEELVLQCPGVVPKGIRVHRRAFCEGGCEHPGHSASPRNGVDAVTTVSAHLEIPTDNGGQVMKIARVTLDSDGGIQKLVVSR